MPDEYSMVPHYSIADSERAVTARTRRWPLWGLRVIMLLILNLQSTQLMAYPGLRVSAEQVEHEDFTMEGVQGHLSKEGVFSLKAENIEVSGIKKKLRGVVIEGAVEEFLSEPDSLVIRAALHADSIGAEIEWVRENEEITASLSVLPQDVIQLRRFDGLPAELAWISSGSVGATVNFRQSGNGQPDVTVILNASDIGFDSPDGLFAAEGLTAEAEISAATDNWSELRIKGTVRKGEVLLKEFYRNFAEGAMHFDLHPEWRPEAVRLKSFSLTDRQTVTVEGAALLDLAGETHEWDLVVSRLDLVFPGAYRRYMEPAMAEWTLDGLGVTGRLSWSGEWADGNFLGGDLKVSDLSVVDLQRGRFAITGLEARLRPGDHQFNSSLDWRGLLVGKVNLGSGAVALDSEPGRFAIVEPLVLEVLGGLLKVAELKVLLPGAKGNEEAEPDIRLRAELLDLDMEQLTAALGWPSFTGTISGVIPGVSLEEGVLDIEGKIEVDVFDGKLMVEDLRIERPFGVLPSLAANIEAANLDLELLTGTFSFGRISGRINGHMRDLRMLDWKPVTFDAWFGTPDSQRGSKGISRKAVNRLTTLGGGSATTALTSPVMRLFSNFSYKRLGLGCRMQNNICDLRGISEDNESVLIMEGAGIPKITIRAFNRSVDWPQLLGQLAVASEGEAIKIGD